jgi:hypothetical protein
MTPTEMKAATPKSFNSQSTAAVFETEMADLDCALPTLSLTSDAGSSNGNKAEPQQSGIKTGPQPTGEVNDKPRLPPKKKPKTGNSLFVPKKPNKVRRRGYDIARKHTEVLHIASALGTTGVDSMLVLGCLLLVQTLFACRTLYSSCIDSLQYILCWNCW